MITFGRLTGIALHVAASEHAIATAEWFAAELATANRHFAALDIGFQLVDTDALPASAVHVATRAERDELATDRLVGKVIHVQELAFRRARAPQGHALVAAKLGFMEAANQGRQHVRSLQIEIIAGSI